MVRSRGRVDINQSSIVNNLRAMGFSVAVTSALGDGFPDIVVGANRVNYLFEIKNPDKFPSHRKLSDDEQKWHDSWRGQVCVIHTVEEALKIMRE